MRTGLALELALDLGTQFAFGRSSPLFYKSQYDLRFWGRTNRGITLDPTLRATGTTPPVATISAAAGGSLTCQVGLHVEIDNVGAGTGLGQATYKWSSNNGTSYVATGVTTAAGPTALGTTGLAIAFAAGPYNINNKWDATAATIVDWSGLGNHATALIARQVPFSLAGFGGYPCLDFGTARTFGYSTPAIVLGVQSLIVAVRGDGNCGYVLTHGGDDNYVFGNAGSSIRANRGATASQKAVSATWIRDGVRKVVGVSFNGTHATHLAYVNGVDQAATTLTNADPGVGTISAALGIGCNPSSFSLGTAGVIHEVMAFGKAIPADVHLALSNGIKARASGAIV